MSSRGRITSCKPEVGNFQISTSQIEFAALFFLKIIYTPTQVLHDNAKQARRHEITSSLSLSSCKGLGACALYMMLEIPIICKPYRDLSCQ